MGIWWRSAAVAIGCILFAFATAPASAEPDNAAPADPAAAPVDSAAAPAELLAAPVDPAAAAVPPPVDGVIASAPPATSRSPDGWTLTVGAKDEVLRTIHPLTTAVSSRDYEVSGVFNGTLTGPDGDAEEEPHGVLEVGYQIGCGIDMSTSNGVSLTGTAGATPGLSLLGIEAGSLPVDAIAPTLLTPVAGGIVIGLKPGIINIVPVDKKEFKGADPWVSVSGFRVKIDGCVGESFIRSYAVLTRSTDISDAIQAYYGTTKQV